MTGLATPQSTREPPLPGQRLHLVEAKFLNAMAAIAIGMFIGNWVIGPSISHDSTDHEALHSAAEERAMINAGMTRPDPFPYRTPTPQFESPGETHYGRLAKERAMAGLGRRPQGGHDAAEAETTGSGQQAQDVPWPDRAREPEPSRAPRFDRHTGVVY